MTLLIALIVLTVLAVLIIAGVVIYNIVDCEASPLNLSPGTMKDLAKSYHFYINFYAQRCYTQKKTC